MDIGTTQAITLRQTSDRILPPDHSKPRANCIFHLFTSLQYKKKMICDNSGYITIISSSSAQYGRERLPIENFAHSTRPIIPLLLG